MVQKLGNYTSPVDCIHPNQIFVAMAEVAGSVLNADSSEDPGVIVQHLGEERGHGLVAAKPFVKGQTILREKVIMKTSIDVLLYGTFI